MSSTDGVVPGATSTEATIRRSRGLAVGSLLALLALALAWELWLAPLRPGGSWWALKALPLLLPLPGLWRGRLYTFRWTTLLLWFYVAEGLVRGTSESGPSALLAWGQTLLALVLFAACVWQVRARRVRPDNVHAAA